MPKPHHFRPGDLRSAARLAVDATLGVVGIAEHLHQSIQRLAPPLGPSSAAPARGISGWVYRAVRGVTRAAGGGVDLLLRPLESLLQQRGTPGDAASDEREAVVAALNGVIGDHLEASGNALAIRMTLQHAGRVLPVEREALAAALPDARPRVLLLVHGLCMHPRQWSESAGLRLAQAFDGTPLHLHYNTGRAIGANGRELAALLQQLAAAWPVKLEAIAIVGHSMGGLVARSALHYGAARGDRWPTLVAKMVFLGTPHHGSPLERAGRIVDVALGASPYTAAFARIGGQRSAGITDLRHGRILDSESAADGLPQHIPLPESVACYAVAGVLARKDERWKSRLLGDGLVTVDSALGRHMDVRRTLAFPPGRQWTAQGVGHLGLMADGQVLDRVEAWLKEDSLTRPGCAAPP